MTTAISSKGQIVLPAEIRRMDGIEAGQRFEIERIDCGEYRLTRKTAKSGKGLAALLRACPEKGWFTPLESESTDTL